MATPQTLGEVRLVVFLTRGMSLRAWEAMGVLERELALYRKLKPSVGKIILFTYGGAEDLAYRPRLDGMEVLCNRWRLPNFLYRWLAPWLHWRTLSSADVFKTNQTNGAEAAVWARRIHPRAKLIARCGYLWSLNAKRAARGAWSREYWMATRRERSAFAASDRLVVTTTAGRRYVTMRYRVSAEKIRVIPNYIQDEVWASNGRVRGPAGRRLVFVGRLHPEKNLLALIEALRGVDAELVLIGDGPQRAQLERSAREAGVALTLEGHRPHHELPDHFSRADIFILPSHYENHPKALLEAMAWGLPVIGTDVPGIRGLIEHRHTGFLCGTSAHAIRQAVLEILDDPALQEAMGTNARRFALEHFALERVLSQERELLCELIGVPGFAPAPEALSRTAVPADVVESIP